MVYTRDDLKRQLMSCLSAKAVMTERGHLLVSTYTFLFEGGVAYSKTVVAPTTAWHIIDQQEEMVLFAAARAQAGR